MVEKIITINLRKQLVKEANWKRADVAISILKKVLRKKTKSKDVKINKGLNEFFWKGGSKHPPTKVRVKIVESDKTVTADIIS